jgi:hypothetical protein
MVNVNIIRVITKYREIDGNTTPLLNNPITKYRTKKYTNRDLINCFIIAVNILMT